MEIISFINLPNCIQWDQVKDNTKWLSKGSLFYSHGFLTSTIKPHFGQKNCLLSFKLFKIFQNL